MIFAVALSNSELGRPALKIVFGQPNMVNVRLSPEMPDLSPVMAACRIARVDAELFADPTTTKGRRLGSGRCWGRCLVTAARTRRPVNGLRPALPANRQRYALSTSDDPGNAKWKQSDDRRMRYWKDAHLSGSNVRQFEREAFHGAGNGAAAVHLFCLVMSVHCVCISDVVYEIGRT